MAPDGALVVDEINDNDITNEIVVVLNSENSSPITSWREQTRELRERAYKTSDGPFSVTSMIPKLV